MTKKQIIIISVTTVSVLFAYLTLGTAGLVSYFLNQNLPSKALSADIKSVRINPFTLSINVKELTVAHQRKQFLTLKEISVDLQWWQLLKGDISLEDGTVNGGGLSAELTNNGLTFAGWDPTQASKNDSSNSNEPTTSNILLSKFSVNKFTIDLAAKTNHQWQIGSFSIADTLINNKGVIGNLTMQSLLNTEELSFAANFKQAKGETAFSIKELTTTIDVAAVSEWLPTAYVKAVGTVKAKFTGDIIQKGQSYLLNAQQLVLDAENVNVPLPIEQQVTSFGFNNLKVTADGSKISVNGNKVTGIVNTNLSVNKLLWEQPSIGDVLLSLEAINLQNTKINLDEDLSLTFDTLLMSEGKVSQKSQVPEVLSENIVELKPLLTFHKIDVGNVQLDAKKVSVGSVVANLDKLSLYKTKESPLENLVLFVAKSKQELATEDESIKLEKDTVSEKASSGLPIALQLDSVVIAGNPHVVLHDFTASEPVVQDVIVETLVINNISSAGDKSATFDFLGHLDKRSSLAVKGEVLPFSPEKLLKAKGELKTVDLTQFSPYIADAIGHKIKQGMLNAKVDISVKENIVSGKVASDIRAIALSSYSGKQHKVTNSSLVPLNVAIGQLTDSKGNFKMDIPLSGKFDDPNFGLTGFISLITTKALKQGAKNYLMQTFVPYSNIVTVAMLAGDTLFAITVDDLKFPAKHITLAEKERNFANQIARILNDKKDLQLTACPIVGSADIAENKKGANFTDKQVAQARRLGQQRLLAFTDYLVDEKQIAHDRIVPCTTEVDKDSVLGKLTFTLK